jgi:ABC-type multidrug transport system fused ATPase/permease subunit
VISTFQNKFYQILDFFSILGSIVDCGFCFVCLTWWETVFLPNVQSSSLRLTLYYIGIGAAALIFGYVQISFWVITAARQTTRIRKQFFHSILAQDISWFDGSDICELNTRMTG